MHCLKVLIYFCLAITLLSADNVKFKKVKPAPGISVVLPEDFVAMTDDYIASKYPSYRKPLAMYTSPSGNIDFGVNFSNNLWGKRLDVLKSVYKASIMNLYLKTTFIQDTIITHKKRDYIVFEFISEQEARATSNTSETIKFYTNIRYTVVNNRIYLFNFTCPYHDMEDWQSRANHIMNSIKINGAKTKLIPDNSVVKTPNGKTSKESILQDRKSKSLPSK